MTDSGIKPQWGWLGRSALAVARVGLGYAVFQGQLHSCSEHRPWKVLGPNLAGATFAVCSWHRLWEEPGPNHAVVGCLGRLVGAIVGGNSGYGESGGKPRHSPEL